MHPIHELMQKASDISRVSLEEAFRIDELKLGEKFGEYHLAMLSLRFHQKIYKDDSFESLFPVDIEETSRNFSEFFLQRFGGQCFFAERHGPAYLLATHAEYDITPHVAEKWLFYMNEAIDEMENATDKEIEAMKSFFRFTIYFLVVAQVERNKHFQEFLS